MKIYVYAIARNEAAFARRWMESMREADGVYVLEWGSADGTAELLRSLGAEVTREPVTPWRFDAARNRAMDLPPRDGDILVCTDLDEVFLPGWRARLEKAWRPEHTTARYEYVWSFRPDGTDGVKFFYEKIHRPGICRWVHPVHEVLRYDRPQVYCDVPGLRLEHHPDPAKSRAGYLPLLKLSVREEPEDDRNCHYLGREYMFRRQWRKAIGTLETHLRMPGAVWRPERAASMRYIARCQQALGEDAAAELWLLRAAQEAPEQREALVELAQLMAAQERWPLCERYCRMALAIQNREMSYITDAEAWGARPWDLLGLACWYEGKRAEAALYARRALALEPGDARLRKDWEWMTGAPGGGA